MHITCRDFNAAPQKYLLHIRAKNHSKITIMYIICCIAMYKYNVEVLISWSEVCVPAALRVWMPWQITIMEVLPKNAVTRHVWQGPQRSYWLRYCFIKSEFKKLQDSIKIRTQRLGAKLTKNISLLLQKGSTIIFVAFVDKNQLIEK